MTIFYQNTKRRQPFFTGRHRKGGEEPESDDFSFDFHCMCRGARNADGFGGEMNGAADSSLEALPTKEEHSKTPGATVRLRMRECLCSGFGFSLRLGYRVGVQIDRRLFRILHRIDFDVLFRNRFSDIRRSSFFSGEC